MRDRTSIEGQDEPVNQGAAAFSIANCRMPIAYIGSR